MPVTRDRPTRADVSTERRHSPRLAAVPVPITDDPARLEALIEAHEARHGAELAAAFAAWARPRGEQFFFSRTPFFETRVSDLYADTTSSTIPTTTREDVREWADLGSQRRLEHRLGRAARLDPPGTP